MLSHDAELGVKRHVNRGGLASYCCTAGCLWVAQSNCRLGRDRQLQKTMRQRVMSVSS